MNKSNISRSKEFIEKERKAREGLRISIERELVGDMIRLLDDKQYCDVTFVIENEHIPVHVAILCARAPAFSQKFLPQLLTPTAVQSCIYIQDLKPEEFLGFLRSVYTENKVLDYSATEYPWMVKVSWSYPKDVIQHEQQGICKGLEDSIEDSLTVSHETNHEGPSKTREVEADSKLEGMFSCYQQVRTSEKDSQIHTGFISNENELQESDCHEEMKEEDCEIVVHECLLSEPGAKTKEPKNTGSLHGEEVNLIELKACCKIGEDLLTLVNDDKTSDVTFLLNNTERIKAHRSILCTRSSYFSAMMYGGWTEGQATEIPLHGIQSSRAFLAVLYYLYGGITRVPLEIADICEVLRLSDMYGLEGLKEVVSCQLRIEKCHLFHKPCSECVVGVIDCLDVSDLFQLSDLKSQSIRWIAKYFDRVYGTKMFASLSKSLQDETHAFFQSTMSVSNVLDLFSRGEKLISSIPCIKWAEPVLPLVSSHVDSCLSFIASNFPVIARQRAFLDMLKGVGWSTPLLEKIFTTVRQHLTVNNCCEQLKEAMRLQSILNADVALEEAFAKQFSEESYKLVDSLQSRCQEFIVSNLHRVSHTEGWKHLGPRTQNEVRKTKGGLFVDLGLPSQSNNPRKRPPPDKRCTKTPSSLKPPATGLTSSGRPHGSDGVDGTRRSRTAAPATGMVSRSRPQGSADRTRRSVQDTTLSRTTAPATGVTARSRTQGSADRTRRSVQESTLSRASSAASVQSSRGRPRGLADSSHSTTKTMQDTTSRSSSAVAGGLANRSRPKISICPGEKSRRSAQDAASNCTSVSTAGLSSTGRHQVSGSSDRTRRFAQDTKSRMSLTSRTMKGTEGKNASMTSLSQNLPKQESSKRYSRSVDVSASSSMSTSTSNKKKLSSASKAVVSSTTPPIDLPHRISRSYSDFNRAKLVDVSGRKYLSDPSISESTIKPKTHSGRITGRIRMNVSTNPNVPSKPDSSARRIKLARESFVGPVRQAQRGKSQPNVREKKEKTQEVPVKSNQNDSASSVEPRLVETQSTKIPLPAQAIPTSETSRILNETITIATGSELDTSSEVTSADASRSNESSPMQDDLLNEASETSSSPEDDEMLLKEPVEACSLLHDRIVLNETTEAALIHDDKAEASSLQESDGMSLDGTVEASLVQENDGLPLNGTAEVSSKQEHDCRMAHGTAEVSSKQEHDCRMAHGTAEVSLMQEHDCRMALNGTAEVSLMQEHDCRMALNGTAEVSSMQEHDCRMALNGTAEVSLMQEHDCGMAHGTAEVSSMQEHDCRMALNGTAEVSLMQEHDCRVAHGTAEASLMQEHDCRVAHGTAEVSLMQEHDCRMALNGVNVSSTPK